MTEMKVVLFSSLLCMMLGLGVIVGGGVALPLTNSAIDNLQNKAQTISSKPNDFLASAQNAINSTQVTLLYLSPSTNESLPSLADNGQLASNAANNLTSVGSKMIGGWRQPVKLVNSWCNGFSFGGKHINFHWSTVKFCRQLT